ncbi:hypothetical protein JZU46_05085 [bacterium]|nr:hypothetical protein [bacterium]
MQILKNVLARLRKNYYQWHYHHAAKEVLKTTPITLGQLPFMLLSMVHQRDVLSYLVAVKSFASYANPSRIVVVCDPSIATADREVLRSHVPHIELVDAVDFVHPDIPRGGCWERLFAISHYVESNYVVQLDADTVTFRPIPEVLTAIQKSEGFVLGEEADQPLLSLETTSHNAKGRLQTRPHIQTYSEVAMVDVGLPPTSKYVRGCAGFTGFPQTNAMRVDMLNFSRLMKAHFEEKWSTWGTEQVASNFLVANAPGTTVLPFPKYGTPDAEGDDTAFLHYIGSLRFINRKYQHRSEQSVRYLLKSN